MNLSRNETTFGTCRCPEPAYRGPGALCGRCFKSLTSGQAPSPAGSTNHADTEKPGAFPSTAPHANSGGATEAPGRSEYPMYQARALDLCCGAGGMTKGLQRAGFYVVGVDNKPQPNYCGDEFHQRDALGVLREMVAGQWFGYADVVHISVPCQRYSGMSNCRPGLADEYPDMIAEARDLLEQLGVPYVIENVPGAPMRADVTLCGRMFGLELYRHRLFESNVPMMQPSHPPHTVPASRAGHWKPGTIMSVSGHVSPISVAREAMGIDWMTRDELAEAIPPAFGEYVGQYLLAHVQQERIAA